MLRGAMGALVVGDPWPVSTDVGPVIDAEAKERIEAHVASMADDGRVDLRVGAGEGLFVPPTVVRLPGIEDLEEEIFGPVLHVATYAAHDVGRVIDAINAKGYGLTFGLHTRIDDRVEEIVGRVRCGNIYVNRNQIGAIVGSQPFGGEGLSGTGPKAGGPRTVARLARGGPARLPADEGAPVSFDALQAALDALPEAGAPLRVEDLPGPTGESNRLSSVPRGKVICAGPTLERARKQAQAARAGGNSILLVAPGASQGDVPDGAALDGVLRPEDLARLRGVAAVAFEGEDRRAVRRALAERPGPIVPVLSAADEFVIERHLCVDTSAAGGNAKLLSSTEEDDAPAASVSGRT
jgi:RHH-type proline utilization regulon transcriptional repressor/proline dehydrogenase/delta 1-pyrroline-5-carboxylate dehydrogenase